MTLINYKETVSTWAWRALKAGYRQNALADELGIPRGLMSEYINGKKKPSIERFQEIENFLRTQGV